MKYLCALFLLSFCFYSSYAQKQKEEIYFFKDDGTLTRYRDSAATIRIIREPAKGQTLFAFLEYYSSGNKKTIGQFSIQNGLTKKEKTWVYYYKNGKRRRIESYNNNRRTGDEYDFYEDGHLKAHRLILNNEHKNPTHKTLALSDELGKSYLDTTNSGYAFEKDSLSVAEGNYLNGFKTGFWKEKFETFRLEEHYEKGKLIKGMRISEKDTTIYTLRETKARFPNGGQAAFMKKLTSSIKYPSKSGNEAHESGIIKLRVVIENDGNIGDVFILESTVPSKDSALIAAVPKDKWIPAQQFGVPVRDAITIPFTFTVHQSTGPFQIYRGR